jgi:hypothetical protein
VTGLRAVEASCWTAVAMAVWIASLASVTGEELWVALPAAVLCAGAAIGTRLIIRGRWRFRRSWLHDLAALPIAIVVETCRTLRAVLRTRRPHGRTSTVTHPKRERADVAAARRAVEALITAASPAAYVLDTDPRRREMTVHTLVDRWRSR